MTQRTSLTTKRTNAPTFLMIGLLGAALAGCDGQPAGAPSPSPAAQPQSAPSAVGGATPPTDVNAAVPMDDAAGTPATPWPAGGAPAGAAVPPPAAGPPADDAPAAAAGQRQSVEGLSFELAEGWTLKPPSGMRLGTVTDGQVEIALSSFGGDVGGKLANVNRWRQQVGLGPITEAELEQETRTIEVDGRPVMVVDAAGPETRLLAASVPGDGKLFFARLMGPADVVGARKDAFEAFVKSIKVE